MPELTITQASANAAGVAGGGEVLGGLPEIDGLELMRRYRAMDHGDAGAVPAVALTAFNRAADRMAVLQAGYRHHIPKPVDPDGLIETLVTVLEPL